MRNNAKYAEIATRAVLIFIFLRKAVLYYSPVSPSPEFFQQCAISIKKCSDEGLKEVYLKMIKQTLESEDLE